ncbi:map3k19 [Pungitius sinensis]
METLTDIREAHKEAERGSRRGGLSLPSLGDSSRRCSHLDSAPLPGLRSTRTACMPAPPKNRQSTRGVVAASQPSIAPLSVAEPRQLSRSAPSIMEPLCSTTVMQARAHIQTRLVFQDTVNEQKGPLLAPHPRMPKLLAPLNSRPGDIAALPVLKHRVPLKPISRSALCSRTWLRRERLIWGSPRTGLLITKGGSEESGSSSQSSCDLEDEEDESDVCEEASGTRSMKLIGDRHLKNVSCTEVGETQQHFEVLSKTSSLPPIHRLEHGLDGELIDGTNSHCQATNGSVVKYQYAQQDDTVNEKLSITSKCKEEKNNLGCTPKPDTKSSHGILFLMNNDHGEAIASCEGTYRIDLQHIQPSRKAIRDSCCEEARVDDPIPPGEDEKLPSISTDEAIELFTPARTLPRTDTDTRGDERRLRTLKPVLNNDRRTSVKSELRAVILTTQLSLSVLAQKNQSNLNRNKSKSNVKSSTQGKDKTRNGPELIISGETVKNLKSRLNSVKSVHCHIGPPSPRKKISYQGKRGNPDKLNRAQQHAPEKELKSIGQLKRPGVPEPPRSKCTADFTTYRDMFQEIQNGGEALATCEVITGPVHDNVQVHSSREKVKGRQVQSAPARKTQQDHEVKHRPLKQARRNSPKESVVISAKSKPKLAFSGMKPPFAAAPRNGTHRVKQHGHTKAELVPSKDVGLCQSSAPETALSTIEKTLSRYGSETIKSNDKRWTAPAASFHQEDDSRPHMQEIRDPDRPAPEPLSSQSPQQPKITTWTSSCSSNSIMSPVYQRFLDEVGDGPPTDDLLQCLAEELITLDQRSVSTGPEVLEFNGEDDHVSRKTLLEDNSIDRAALLGCGLVVDDTTTWTKGEVLGRGAYGIVYCGLTSRGQLIAVKQVSLESLDPDPANAAEYGRLQREVELLKNLRHANVVGFLGTSLYQHVVSIFMEYIPGGSIASILYRFGPLPERVLALYTHQILDGVAYLHLNRVIHRDLKGNNVMLMPTGVIKLIDFGCARRLSCLNHTASHSTDLLKSVHGTPYWMAPEVISETGYGRKSDIWSVGCTVFEMATGKPPLAHMDKMAALFYIGARRGSMPTLPTGFSDHARNFVKICLTSDQRLRPSADQLLKHSFIPKREAGGHSKNCCAHPEGLCG